MVVPTIVPLTGFAQFFLSRQAERQNQLIKRDRNDIDSRTETVFECATLGGGKDPDPHQFGTTEPAEEPFKRMESFNEDMSKWNTGEVTNMYGMFYRASVFNQDACPLTSVLSCGCHLKMDKCPP
jgi:surface protein